MADLFADHVVRIYRGDRDISVMPGLYDTYTRKGSLSATGSPSTVSGSLDFPKFGAESVKFIGRNLSGTGYMGVESAVGCVEAWVRPNSVAGAQGLFAIGADEPALPYLCTLVLYEGQLAVVTYDGVSLLAGSVPAGTYTAIAWSSTPHGLHRVFVNGALVLTYQGPTLAGAGYFTAGAYYIGGSRLSSLTYPNQADFVGYMDEIRVTGGVPRYIESYVPETAEFSSVQAPRADGVAAASGAALAEGGAVRAPSQSSGAALGASTLVGRAAFQLSASASATASALCAAVSGVLAPLESDPTLTAGTATVAGSAVSAADGQATLFFISGSTGLSTAQVSTGMSADPLSDAAASAPLSVSSGAQAQSVRDGALSTALTAQGAFATQLELTGALTSLLRVFARLPNEPGRGEAWSVSLLGGSSRYEGFSFNSFALYAGQQLGCRADGIYVLEGADDAGEPVRASVSFGRQAMGSPMLKRMITAYAEVASSEPLTLKVSTSQGEFVYPARGASSHSGRQRFDVGRKIEGSTMVFELFNNEGSDFTLSGFEALAADVSHRRI